MPSQIFEPEVEDHAIDRPAGRKTQRLENGEPRRQSDREGWKDECGTDGEGELKFATGEGPFTSIAILPALSPQVRFGEIDEIGHRGR